MIKDGPKSKRCNTSKVKCHNNESDDIGYGDDMDGSDATVMIMILIIMMILIYVCLLPCSLSLLKSITMSGKMKLVVCGGGGGSHALAGIAACDPDIEVRVLTLFEDEAERFTNEQQKHDFSVFYHHHGKEVKTAKPPKKFVITKKPEEVVPGCDVIVLVLPAFAHEKYIKAAFPFLEPGMIIAGLPGQPGFEFEVRSILKEKVKFCTLASFESLPWVCRVREFGKSVDLFGLKEKTKGAIQLAETPPKVDAHLTLQRCVGTPSKLETKGHILGTTLMAVNAILHPSITYLKWKDWDGQPVDEPPIFYSELSKESADFVYQVSLESVAIAKKIMSERPGLDLSTAVSIYDYYCRVFPDEIEDKSSFYTLIHTMSPHKNLRHPMIKTDDGKYVPDKKSRYLLEDVPIGLVVLCGIAEIVGIAAPKMLEVLTWAQKQMGKEYLVDGKICGKDLGETRAPQRFGISNITQLLGDELIA